MKDWFIMLKLIAGENPEMVKRRLKQWAQVIACAARQPACYQIDSKEWSKIKHIIIHYFLLTEFIWSNYLFLLNTLL